MSQVDEYYVEALLVNWGQWARGIPADLDISDWGGERGPAVQEDLAQRAERVLVDMRRERKGLWRAVKLRYVEHVSDITASRACGLSQDGFNARILSAYSWFWERWEHDATVKTSSAKPGRIDKAARP